MILNKNFLKERLWGWNDRFEAQFKEQSSLLKDPIPARIVSESHGIYQIYIPAHAKITLARIRGKIHHQIENREAMPAVGDWVVVDQGAGAEGELRIEILLPRQSVLKRKAPRDRGYNQIFASNIDEVWVVTSLNHDFSENRMDRILSLVSDGGARARILLTKADLVSQEELDRYAQIMQTRFPKVKWCFVRAFEEASLEQLRTYLQPQQTYVLVGSSGVGKSTIINRLLGRDKFVTREVREEDSKGRHTTTHRELIMLDGGALFVDTPGVREWQLLDDEESMTQYEDIEALALKCKFTNCRHQNEPHCAIKKSLEVGQLSDLRWQAYLRLKNIEPANKNMRLLHNRRRK